MTPETQARIFEPFFTTKDVGKGTGLGLSMVYGTLKQIGGFIFVDSEVDRGTTFRLYFPPAAAPGGRPRRRRAPPSGTARHETLLIVEDEPAVRNLVASALRHDGYRLLLAASAEEALALADAHDGRIDLLLTDAIMPGKSGHRARQPDGRAPPGPAGDHHVRLHRGNARRPGARQTDLAAAEAVHAARAAAAHQRSARSVTAYHLRGLRHLLLRDNR